MGHQLNLRTATLLLTACVTVLAVPQRTVGKPQCLRNTATDTLTTRFVTKLNGDDINHVFGCRLVPGTTDQFVYSTCQFKLETQGTDTYMIVESVIDLNNPNDNTGSNPCGFELKTVSGFKELSWTISLRYKEGLITHIDRDYHWTCKEQLSTDTYITTTFDVSVNNLVQTPTVQNPTFNMLVMTRVGNSQTFQEATSCDVGEDLLLEIRMTIPSYQDFQTNPGLYVGVDEVICVSNCAYSDYLAHWGLYAYSTKAAPSQAAMTTSAADSLTDNNGCVVSNNVFEMVGTGFSRQSSSSTTIAIYRTGVFQCERYLRSNQIWFSTYIGLCSGLYEGDSKCTNYCNYNNINGRRKRQTHESTPRNVKTVITVVDKSLDKPASGNSFLVIAIAAVGAFVAIALIAIVAFLIVSMRRRRESSRDNSSSYAASDSTLPVKH